MNMIEKAERRSRSRAMIFYLLAAILLLSTILAVSDHGGSGRLIPWYLMTLLIALNLTDLPFRLRSGRLAKLMNDENTQDHRRTSFQAGFWAAILSALICTGAAAIYPLGGVTVGRMVATAALVAALLSFAIQERIATQ